MSEKRNSTVNVTYIDHTGREVRSMDVAAYRIYTNDSGVLVFHQSKHFPACKVVSFETVSEFDLDSQLGYFKQYGTACE